MCVFVGHLFLPVTQLDPVFPEGTTEGSGQHSVLHQGPPLLPNPEGELTTVSPGERVVGQERSPLSATSLPTAHTFPGASVSLFFNDKTTHLHVKVTDP